VIIIVLSTAYDRCLRAARAIHKFTAAIVETIFVRESGRASSTAL